MVNKMNKKNNKNPNSFNVKFLLNAVAKQEVQINDLGHDQTTETITIFSITVALGILFGELAVSKLADKLRKMPLDCLKFYKDPLIQQLLQELKALIDLLNQFTSVEPESMARNLFSAIANTNAEDLITNSIEDILKRIKGLVSDLSLGKCGKIWGDIFADLLSLGFPDWIKDLIQKAVSGVIGSAEAVGAMLNKYNPQAAAAWATRSIIKENQGQPIVVTQPSIDWGTVAIIVGVTVIVVFTAGAAGIAVGGILIGAVGGVAGTALGERSNDEIQQMIQERIKQQEGLSNG